MNLLESRTYHCPYCGEENEALVDRSLPEQSYIEDCSVCCRPITLQVTCEPQIRLIAKRDDE
ncbi:CPXCG motif-containing cysteine-rich protein [Candidatus Thiodiazotropha endoloripes]|uniref:CPXCG motif-containing cysteine-rich protein n=1 Tax=Candidatus Thiodiazotropha endoloripes TaxID=1818881 RepID=UPI0039C870E7